MPFPLPLGSRPLSWLLQAISKVVLIGLATLLPSVKSLDAESAVDTKTAPTAKVGQSRGDGQDANRKRSAKEIEEYRVKADILYSFLKYSKFPEGTFTHKKSPIVVLILGDDPFGPLLKTAFAGKKLDGRSVQIRRLKRAPSRIYAHLVFAHGLKAAVRTKLISDMRSRPCLLVAEAPGFAEAGGFINFYSDKGKVRFEINAQRLKSTGVQLKAELLKLARLIGEEPAPVEK